jgi:mono/diheme cytochrome c family protein
MFEAKPAKIMKKVFKALGYIMLILLVCLGCFLGFIEMRGVPKYAEPTIPQIKVEVTPERVALGQKIATVQCMFCHKGEDGNMTGRYVSDLPPDFGKIFSANITQSKAHGIGAWTDGEIMYFLRTGVRKNGQYAPIYMPKYTHMSDEDMKAVIAWLRSDYPQVQPKEVATIKPEPSLLVKFLCMVAFKPMPYPAQAIAQPDTINKKEFGEYLVLGRYECWSCHSADFKTLNFSHPENTPGFCQGGNLMYNHEGKKIFTANITPDEKTGLGGWTEDDFRRSMHESKNKDGKTLRYPMMPYNMASDAEVAAIWQYLRSIPALSNEVDRQWDKDL